VSDANVRLDRVSADLLAILTGGKAAAQPVAPPPPVAAVKGRLSDGATTKPNAEVLVVDCQRGRVAKVRADGLTAEQVKQAKADARKRATAANPAAKRAASKSVAPVQPVSVVEPVVPAGGKLSKAERKAKNRALWAELASVSPAERAERWAARTW
jgi:hypothetical protein